MKHIITSALYLIVLLSLSVFVFDKMNLYYELTWLDIPMHMLGGFGIAALVLSVESYRHKKVSFISVITLYMIVAIGWELFGALKEALVHVPWSGWFDTMWDVINGGIGATCAYYLLKK